MVAAAISCLTAIQKGREIGQVQPVVDEPFGRVREIEELAENAIWKSSSAAGNRVFCISF